MSSPSSSSSSSSHSADQLENSELFCRSRLLDTLRKHSSKADVHYKHLHGLLENHAQTQYNKSAKESHKEWILHDYPFKCRLGFKDFFGEIPDKYVNHLQKTGPVSKGEIEDHYNDLYRYLKTLQLAYASIVKYFGTDAENLQHEFAGYHQSKEFINKQKEFINLFLAEHESAMRDLNIPLSEVNCASQEDITWHKHLIWEWVATRELLKFLWYTKHSLEILAKRCTLNG